MAKRPRTNPERWSEALRKAAATLDALTMAIHPEQGQHQLDQTAIPELTKRLQDHLRDLLKIYEGYEMWYDGMRPSALASPSGEKLEAVLELVVEPTVRAVLEWAPEKPSENQFEDIRDLIAACQAADLPAGFGRD